MIAHEEEIVPLAGERGENGMALTLKDMDADLQPREKALTHGIHTLSVSELLAIVLRTGLPGRPVTLICRELMRDNDNSLHTLQKRDRQELTACKGIGMTKALQLEALMELINRYNLETETPNPLIRTSADASAVIRPRIGNLDHEEIWAMLLNRRHQVVRISRITSGGINASVFDVRMLMKQVIMEGCSAMVLCHNHPSGTLRPSPQDDAITRKCKEACAVFDVTMLDHVIVTSHGYYSYRDEGKL